MQKNSRSRKGLGGVIARVNMMPLRTLLLGGITASFAVGGFLVGNHRVPPQDTSTLDLRSPNYRRVPRNRIDFVIRNNSKRLDLTAAQIAKVRKLTEPVFQRQAGRAEKQWPKRAEAAEKISTGEWLPQNVDFAWYFLRESQPTAFVNSSRPWFSLGYEFGQVAMIKGVVGKKAIDQALALSHQIGQQDTIKAFDFATSQSTLAQLNLSPLQEKQFATLRKRVQDHLSGGGWAETRAVKLPDGKAAPRIPNTLLWPIALQMAFSLLDVKQSLVLERLVWDEFTVEP